MSEINPTLLHQMLLHFLTVPSSTAQPSGHGALIKAKGRYKALDGAAMTQQRQHYGHNFRGSLQAKERCTFGL